MREDWELTPDKYLNATELARLLARAEELCSLGEAKGRKPLVRDWMIINTAIYTGLRRAEICNLRVADLRIGPGQSHLVVRTRKGGKTNQIVHIGREYKQTLRRYLRWKLSNGELSPDAYLLRTARSERFSVSGLWLRWRKYCPKKLHSARHTFATMTYAATQNLRLVQKQLSHSRITTTQIYADVTPEAMCAGMDQMERMTRALCKVRPSQGAEYSQANTCKVARTVTGVASAPPQELESSRVTDLQDPILATIFTDPQPEAGHV